MENSNEKPKKKNFHYSVFFPQIKEEKKGKKNIIHIVIFLIQIKQMLLNKI